MVDARGVVIASRRAATPKSFDKLINVIAGFIRELADELGVQSSRNPVLGLALPGPVDRARGILLRSVNLPFLNGRSIAEPIFERTTLKVILMTDADAATWGEFVAAGATCRRFAHLRIGTGIACGLVLDGRLMPTDLHRTTHWDKLIVETDGDAPVCRCGLRGCLELFASGRAIETSARFIKLPGGLSALQASVSAGRKESQRIVRLAAMAISDAIDNLVREFALETMVIGGGVVERLPGLLEEISNRRQVLAGADKTHGSCTVEAARCGDGAGVIGAALLARTASVA